MCSVPRASSRPARPGAHVHTIGRRNLPWPAASCASDTCITQLLRRRRRRPGRPSTESALAGWLSSDATSGHRPDSDGQTSRARAGRAPGRGEDARGRHAWRQSRGCSRTSMGRQLRRRPWCIARAHFAINAAAVLVLPPTYDGTVLLYIGRVVSRPQPTE